MLSKFLKKVVVVVALIIWAWFSAPSKKMGLPVPPLSPASPSGNRTWSSSLLSSLSALWQILVREWRKRDVSFFVKGKLQDFVSLTCRTDLVGFKLRFLEIKRIARYHFPYMVWKRRERCARRCQFYHHNYRFKGEMYFRWFLTARPNTVKPR